MSLSIVHSTTFTGNASNSTVNLSAPASAGNFLIVFTMSRHLGGITCLTDGGQQMTGLAAINGVTHDIQTTIFISADGSDNPAVLTGTANSVSFTNSAGQIITDMIIYEVSGSGMVASGAHDTNTLNAVSSFAGAAMTPATTGMIFSAIGTGDYNVTVPALSVSAGWTLDLVNNIALKPWGLGVARQIASGTQQATFGISPSDLALCPGFFITETGPPSDFSIGASPGTLSIEQGHSGVATITITSLNAYHSAVTISASGLPTGVTAVFSPNPVTPPANSTITSMLTLTVAANATLGTATITIGGTDGVLTHNTSIILTVTTGVNAITGGAFTDAQGNPIVDGKLVIRPSHDAVLTNALGFICAKIPVYISLDANGNVVANTSVWANDQMIPNTITYTAAVLNSNGTQVWGSNSEVILSSPSPFNLSAWIP